MRDFLKDVEKGGKKANGKNPEVTAQAHMRPSFPKRFYKTVTVEETQNGYTVQLDARSIRTPGKNLVELPTRQSAQLCADEWQAQEKEINPLTMPVTRITNTAIDGIALNPQAVLEDIVKFASSDLLCYRAEAPKELVELQRQHWDPVLDWIEKETKARFELATGIIHKAQPKETIAVFSARLANHADPMKLGCLHTFTTLTGSALIALSLAEGFLTTRQAWQAAHVDEDFNISQWGEDFEAKKRRDTRFAEFQAAHDLFRAL